MERGAFEDPRLAPLASSSLAAQRLQVFVQTRPKVGGSAEALAQKVHSADGLVPGTLVPPSQVLSSLPQGPDVLLEDAQGARLGMRAESQVASTSCVQSGGGELGG